jgi:hypothetical protein
MMFFLLVTLKPLTADEGMWPITEIARTDLNNKGLSLPLKEIYNPEGISLMNAIVKLSG